MQNINKKNSEEYIVDRKVESVKTFNMKKAVDKGSKWIFLLSALIAVFSLLLIMGFVFYKGLRPFFAEGYSFIDFIIGTDWYPSSSKFGILPMIIATILGTISAIGALIYMVFIFFKTIINGVDVPGYASLICIMLLLGGIQLISLGIIGEYLGRIFNESKQRPLYLVNEYNGKKETNED